MRGGGESSSFIFRGRSKSRPPWGRVLSAQRCRLCYKSSGWGGLEPKETGCLGETVCCVCRKVMLYISESIRSEWGGQSEGWHDLPRPGCVPTRVRRGGLESYSDPPETPPAEGLSTGVCSPPPKSINYPHSHFPFF